MGDKRKPPLPPVKGDGSVDYDGECFCCCAVGIGSMLRRDSSGADMINVLVESLWFNVAVNDKMRCQLCDASARRIGDGYKADLFHVIEFYSSCLMTIITCFPMNKALATHVMDRPP